MHWRCSIGRLSVSELFGLQGLTIRAGMTSMQRYWPRLLQLIQASDGEDAGSRPPACPKHVAFCRLLSRPRLRAAPARASSGDPLLLPPCNHRGTLALQEGKLDPSVPITHRLPRVQRQGR